MAYWYTSGILINMGFAYLKPELTAMQAGNCVKVDLSMSGIVLCLWARQFSLIVPLYTQALVVQRRNSMDSR